MGDVGSDGLGGRIDHLRFEVIIVLARVAIIPLQEFHQIEEPGRETGSHDGTKPVDPVVPREVAGDNIRSKCPCWVDASASVVDTCGTSDAQAGSMTRCLTEEMSYEQGYANTYGGKVGSLMLDRSKHNHGKGELAGRKHFDEEAASDRSAASQSNIYGHRSREGSGHCSCSGNTSCNLCKEDDTASK